jgi:hypothetical protein
MRAPLLLSLPLLAALASPAGCSSNHSNGATTGDDAGGADAGDDAAGLTPGADGTVSAFDKTPLFFKDWSTSGNQRTVDAPASFPASGAYSKIVLHLTLSCPQGGCDVYDRFGTLGVVTQKSDDGGANTVIEIARFITPYGVGGSWDYDVTDLRPLLTGDLTLEAFIDTWVPQGQSGIGEGWLLTASFEMTGGVPANVPIAVVPVWTRQQVWYGDPAKPIAGSIPPATVALPSGASSYALRTFVTGHGQGNVDNCAEFCSRQHTLTVGSTPQTATVWRTDCATTAVKNQGGVAPFASRAGWCPGADVKAWEFDVTQDVGAGPTASFAYDVASFVNTCRPDAVPDGGSCVGCTLGASCAYDGGLHTEPFFYVSTLLVAYR